MMSKRICGFLLVFFLLFAPSAQASDYFINLVSTANTWEAAQTIDGDGTEMLLVRKDADGGDVFLVDTTNDEVEMIGGTWIAAGTYFGNTVNSRPALLDEAATSTNPTVVPAG